MNIGGGAAQNSGPNSVSPAPGVDAGEPGIKTRLDRPAASVKRHKAGHANYPGDTRHMLGEIKGPLTYGGYVIAVDAQYDPDTDRTRVAFGHATVDDMAAAS